MKTTHARFNNAGSMLVVSLKKGKKAIQISVKRRIAGEKLATGCRESFSLDQASEAQKSFETLRSAALAKGWIEAPRTLKSAFSEIPAPPVVAVVEPTPAPEPVPEPVVVVEEIKPVEKPVEKKSKK